MPLPASQTKHLDHLIHPVPRNRTTPVHLRQLSSSSTSSTGTGTTGTTLWLSAQIAACYLASLPPPTLNGKSRATVLELGSGVGYLALTLAWLGYNVIATDVEPVISTVLGPNVEDGLRVLRSSKEELGDVKLMELDWTVPIPEELSGKEISMIISTDTIYHPPLIKPFFQTLAQLCSGKNPVVILGIERRDSEMVDASLEVGRTIVFDLKRIGRGRVEKAVEKAGWGWKGGEGWEGVEIWRGRFRGRTGLDSDEGNEVHR